VDELGEPVAYTALEEGVPVFDRDRNRIGVVEHVVADDPVDIFEGLIVHTEPLPGRHVYADADQIAELRERGVLLAVGRYDLHELSERPAARQADAEDTPENPLHARLRRAWDWLQARL
jgi:uncharacterized protein YrrD